MYPIIDLRKQQQDLHWYLRSLEEVIIRSLWTASGIKAERVQGLTGVWAGTIVKLIRQSSKLHFAG